MPRIKAAVKEIDEKYYTLFYMQAADLMRLFMQCAPMALFAVLMRPNMRKLYLPENVNTEEFAVPVRENADGEHNITDKSRKKLYGNIITLLLKYDMLKAILGSNLKSLQEKPQDTGKT